ncbi:MULTISPECIES: carbohydrate-binding family 9-like protein [unclassified Saccharicrinis]|uniref:carbohydrate-binding family 9-like protein n=1 Tax=unclassified Saccharicrinis TaxID=2646859 RepID=UPI003D328449
MNRIVIAEITNAENNWPHSLKNEHRIENNNWNYASDVRVGFNIGYDSGNIYLKFFVEESNTKAVYRAFNEPVYEDSCVEFFISLDGENYYNLEFNCIGNILGGYGSERNNREVIPASVLQQIVTKPSLGSNRIEIIDRKTDWTLGVKIPISVFIHDKIEKLNGVQASCNFYKCGDKQVFPHYLSWNPITARKPDFHLPQFFGEIIFNN